MNAEDFEKHLREQPIRQIPADWRQQIITAVSPTEIPHRSLFSTLHSALCTFLWPHPTAWAGLAAVWMVILGLNVWSGDNSHSPTMAKNKTAPSPQLLVALREQQKLMMELAGRVPPPDADRPKVIRPQPRSDRRLELSLA